VDRYLRGLFVAGKLTAFAGAATPTGGFSEGKQFIAQYTDLRVVSQYLLRNVSDWEITLFDSCHLLYLGYCSLTRCRPDPVLPSGNPAAATNS
jgi:hypothetical protein